MDITTCISIRGMARLSEPAGLRTPRSPAMEKGLAGSRTTGAIRTSAENNRAVSKPAQEPQPTLSSAHTSTSKHLLGSRNGNRFWCA